MKRVTSMVLAACVVATAFESPAFGNDTPHDAYTYQGRLQHDGAPVTGPMNLAFRLFDAADQQVGPELTAIDFDGFDDDGRFTIDLAFGAAVFDGAPRWLEIEVNGTILSPRQPVMPTPYAFRALSVATVADEALTGTYSSELSLTNTANQFSGSFVGDGAGLTGLNAGQITSGTLGSTMLSGNYTNPLFFDNNGNFFTGTFFGTGAMLTNLNASSIASGTLNPARLPFGGNWNLSSNLDVGGGLLRVNPGTAGVGIGANPDAKLLVRGDAGLDAFRVRIEGSTKVIVRPNGGVGLGSNFPAIPDNGLRVSGRVALGPDEANAWLHVARSSSAATPHVRIDSTTNNGFARMRMSTAGHESHWDVAAGGANNMLDFWRSDAGSMLTLRGDTSRVGIGTASPSASLHVVEQPFPFGTGVILPGLRLVSTTGAPNVIGGHASNTVAVGVVGATIAGGGTSASGLINEARGNYSTVGGGFNNLVVSQFATIAGGRNNAAGGTSTLNGDETIGGGTLNVVEAPGSTISGGSNNRVLDLNSWFSTISGGQNNQALRSMTTVGGGSGNKAGGQYSVIGGGISNETVQWNAQAATIAGGFENTVGGNYSTIAGGSGNEITTSATYATIAGGGSNTVSASYGVAAGSSNNVSGAYATVIGGRNSTASGDYGFVAGGRDSRAGGDYSFAGGRRAKADHSGTFVWADATDANFFSARPATFIIRANLGMGINTNDPFPFTLAVNGDAAKPGGGLWSIFSDVRLKKDIEPLAPDGGMLDRVLSIHGYTFEYDESVIGRRLALPGRQTGLLAQEVQAVFPQWVDEDPDGYLYVTERGLTAIFVEALRELREEKDAEIAALSSRIERMEAMMEAVLAGGE